MIQRLGCVLTPEEEALLAHIKFDMVELREPDDAERNGKAAAALMKSLAGRNAIPDVRLRYFTDPKYFAGGRGKSHKQLFERNGITGDEIFSHPHFLPYLHYFLHGPSLAQNIVDAFSSEVERCGGVSSSDVVPLGKFARQQVRAHGLEPGDAAEHFYKLALDCGLSASDARLISDSVKHGRRRSKA
jgi:hypothetical protein